jgi:hypothetical protein
MALRVVMTRNASAVWWMLRGAICPSIDQVSLRRRRWATIERTDFIRAEVMA